MGWHYSFGSTSEQHCISSRKACSHNPHVRIIFLCKSAHNKKNWLFIGGEATGQRSAIIYTLIECARRHGHNPEAYLADILERLPAMTNQDDLTQLLPSRWRAAAATDPAPETALSV